MCNSPIRRRGAHLGSTVVLATLLTLLAAGPAAVAQDAGGGALDTLTPEAQQRLLELLKAGNDAFDGGRYETAIAFYDEARALGDLPQVAYRRALCLGKMKRYDEAIEAWRHYLALRPDAPDRGRVETEISQLQQEQAEKTVAHLDILSTPAGASVRIEGDGGLPLGRTPVSTAIEPGTYNLVLELDGHHPRTTRVLAEPGKSAVIEISLDAIDTTPPGGPVIIAEPTNWAAWGLGAGGTGAALLVTSGVFYVMTAQRIDDANAYDRADPANTRAGLADIQSPISAMKATTFVTGGVGAALVGLGVVFLLLDEDAPEQEPPVGARLLLGPDTMGVSLDARF